MRWSMVEFAPPPTTLLMVSIDLMEDLLLRFEPLFREPTGLSLPRQCSHQIWLHLDTVSVVVWPYSYVHG
jgi:hypothetical protein